MSKCGKEFYDEFAKTSSKDVFTKIISISIFNTKFILMACFFNILIGMTKIICKKSNQVLLISLFIDFLL